MASPHTLQSLALHKWIQKKSRNSNTEHKLRNVGFNLFSFCITCQFQVKLNVMNSFPVKEKPLSKRLLKTAYELFYKKNSSFQSMLEKQEGQICVLGLQQ